MRGLVLLTALLLAPAATADLQLEVAVDADVVRPGLTSANATVEVSLDCPQVLARTSGGQMAANVEVQVTSSGAAAVSLSGPTVLVVPVEPCRTNPTGRSMVNATYITGLQGSLPASVPQEATVTASIPEFLPTVAPAESKSASFTLKAAAVPALQVRLERPVVALEGPTAQVPLRFTNLGNVPLTLEAKATPRNATIGGTLTIPAVELAVGASADVAATFTAPAGLWDSQVMIIEITPVAKGGERGVPLRVEVLFRAPAVDQTAPLPAASLLALTLLAAAAFAQRRA